MAINPVGFGAPTFVAPTDTRGTSTPTRGTSSGPVDTFRATGATGDSGAAARSRAVDEALSALRGLRAPSPDPQNAFEVDVHEWMDDSELGVERQPFEDRIRALGNQSPPLSPEEIKAQASAIQEEWSQGLAIIKSALELMISMVQFNQGQMLSAMGGL